MPALNLSLPSLRLTPIAIVAMIVALSVALTLDTERAGAASAEPTTIGVQQNAEENPAITAVSQCVDPLGSTPSEPMGVYAESTSMTTPHQHGPCFAIYTCTYFCAPGGCWWFCHVTEIRCY